MRDDRDDDVARDMESDQDIKVLRELARHARECVDRLVAEGDLLQRQRDELQEELAIQALLTATARVALGHMTNSKIAEGCRLLDEALGRERARAVLRDAGRSYAQAEHDEALAVVEDKLPSPVWTIGNPSWREGYNDFHRELRDRGGQGGEKL